MSTKDAASTLRSQEAINDLAEAKLLSQNNNESPDKLVEASADRSHVSIGSSKKTSSGQQLNLSSGKKSSSSVAKKTKQVRTRAQTSKPAKSKPKKD